MTVPIMAEPIGTTRALQEVSIRARVRGFLKEIHFEEGGDVKEGQLLFVIDEEPFKAKLAEAQAQLDAGRGRPEEGADSKAREVATAQLALGQAMLALAEVEERREQSLLQAQRRLASRTSSASRPIRQKDAAQVEADKASLEQAKADYETSILAAQADVDGGEGPGHRRRDRPELLPDVLADRRPDRPGPGQARATSSARRPAGGGADYTELAVVRQLDPMGVDIQVSSRYLDRVTRLIAQGLPVEVFRPGLEGEEARRFRGKATVIDNTIDPTTSTFLVQAEVANPEKTLLPGEYVKVDAKVGEARDAVVVPEQAVVETQAGPTVYTVDKQGKVAVAPVRATLTYEGLRVLESGLEPGQPVIVEGLQLVRAGMTVKTEPAPPDGPDAPGAAARTADGRAAPESRRAAGQPDAGRP